MNNKIPNIIILAACAVLFISFPGASQTTAPNPTGAAAMPDSLRRVPKAVNALDSLAATNALQDTATMDTMLTGGGDLDTIIVYEADTVSFTFEPRVTVLSGKASVQYRETKLNADHITINWDDQLLFAKGRLDTVKVDSLYGRDSLKWIGLPSLDDGTQVITGESMVYNLKTKRGRVTNGNTTYQDGYYHGTRIKRMDSRTYNIESGWYTTCDAEEPHYHFWASEMKLVVKDKIVAKPVVLYFGPVPVMIIPFAVFSTKGGRQSGLIIPTYGESGSQGRFFRNLGYYWAPNDYFDVKGALDYYERYGILFRGDAYYSKRYILNGSLSGSLINQHRDSNIERRWDISFNHNQTIDPTMNLAVTGKFVSDNSYWRDVSQNRDDWLTKTITSNATLSKKWLDSPYYATLNVNYHKDLTSGNINESLPRLTFSRSRSAIFPAAEGVDKDDEMWWNKLFYNYSGSGELKKSLTVSKIIRYEPSGDSVISVTDEVKNWRARSGVKHNLTFSFTPDPIYYLALTPSINYTELWYDEYIEYNLGEDGQIDSTKHDGLKDGFKPVRTYSASMRASTKLYGLFKPNLFTVEAIRHTLSPSLSFTYQPDFSDPKWGYYDRILDSEGVEKYYNRYAGAIYGSAPSDEKKTLGISVGNLFEYKQVKDDKETKGQLLNLNLSTSYNFAADSLKWADLTSSARIPTLGAGLIENRYISKFSGLSLQLNGHHSFYALEENPGSLAKTKVDRPAPNFLRLQDFELSTSMSITGGTPQTKRDSTKASLDSDQTQRSLEDRFGSREWVPSPYPWKAGLSFRYREDHRDPDNVATSITATSSFEIDATKNWKIGYDARFDLHDRKIVSSGITLYRDLHCWEGRLTWNPMGLGQGLYVKINIKSPQLQDIKIEKNEGGVGGFGY